MDSVFSDWEKISFYRIGEVITMAFQVSAEVLKNNGWISPRGQVLQKADYPLLYLAMSESPDAEIRSLIIDENSFRAPNWTGRYLREHGVGNTANNGGGGQVGLMYGDAIRNIEGTWQSGWNVNPLTGFYTLATTGCFKRHDPIGTGNGRILSEDGPRGAGYPAFDASRVVPTASENRVFTVNVVYYIKAK